MSYSSWMKLSLDNYQSDLAFASTSTNDTSSLYFPIFCFFWIVPHFLLNIVTLPIPGMTPTQQLPTREDVGYHLLLCIFLNCFLNITYSENSAICPLHYALAHIRPWLAIIDRGKNTPPLPLWEHSQFCSLELPATDGCGIIKIRTSDLWMMRWTLLLCHLGAPFFPFSIFCITEFIFQNTDYNILSTNVKTVLNMQYLILLPTKLFEKWKSWTFTVV